MKRRIISKQPGFQDEVRISKVLFICKIFFVFCLFSNTVSAQFFYVDSCRNSTGIFKYFGDAPGYTANIVGTGDSNGQGWLRLTHDTYYNSGYVLVTGKYPSDRGLTVEFDFKIWGNLSGERADGFSVYLFDGMYNDPDGAEPRFSPGYFAGGLGYLPYDQAPGAKGGYLGVGIDEYGTFYEYSQGGFNVGQNPNMITVVGSESKGYPYIQGTNPNGTFNVPLNGVELKYAQSTTTRPSDNVYYRRLRVELVPENKGLPNEQMRVTVSLKSTASGQFYELINTIIPTSSNLLGALPSSLRVGFGASTGAYTANHEVRDVIVKTPGDLVVYKDISECAGYDGFPIITTISNSMQSNVGNVIVRDTLPAEFEVLSYSGGVFEPGGEPVLTMLPDGRQLYTYTVQIFANQNMQIFWNGRLGSMPVNQKLRSGTSITPPPGFEDNGNSDLSAYIERDFSGLVGSNPPIYIYKNSFTTLHVTGTAGATYRWEKLVGGIWVSHSGSSTTITTDVLTFAVEEIYKYRCIATWGNQCSDVAEFTIMKDPDSDLLTVVDMTVFLHGPLQINGIMTNYIQVPHPSNSAFTSPLLPVANPYNIRNDLNQVVSYGAINNENGVAGSVVDWIKVEIREVSDPRTILETKALLLKPNGKVIDIDGELPRFISQTVPIFLVVRHRNHLSVASQQITDFSGIITYNFSTNLTQAYKNEDRDPSPMVKPYSSVNTWCLWTGNMNLEEIVDNTDISMQEVHIGKLRNYIDADLDMNGIVDNVDVSLILTSGSVGPYSPILPWEE